MIKTAFLAAVLASAVGCQTGVPPETASFDQESRLIFGWVMTQTVGTWNTAALAGYGCYCGGDNAIDVLPIDATDKCCFIHDYAWVDAPTVEGPGCNCNTQSYEYDTKGGTLNCSPKNTGCAKYCCEADQEFTECIKRTGVGPNQRYDRSRCEPIECKTDDDCDGGTYCDFGSCVPYCGGSGFAACPTPTPAPESI